MVKEPGQDSARKAPDVKAARDAKRARAERRLTLEHDDPLLQELEQAGEISALDLTTFKMLCERHPERLFNGLYDHMSRLEQAVEDAQERSDDGDDDEEVQSREAQITELKKTVKDQRNAMAELIQERDDALARVQELARETESPLTASVSQKKSSKLPDGKRFNDGKEPTFESWLIDIENKLEANADHYPTPLSRMQYVKSMCEGEAAEHLIPRFQKNSPGRYRDVDDILEHLKTIYHDANKATKAKRELRRLYQNDTKFQDFLSKFVLKAQESMLPVAQWKDELYERLSPEMQRQLVKASYDDDLSYGDFVRECHQTANRLEIIIENEKRAPKNRGNKNGAGKDNKKDQNGAAKDDKKDKDDNKDRKDRLKISWAERQKLIAEGKCFRCKMPGHTANDCNFDEKKRTPDLKALEPAAEAKNESSSESENEDA